MTVAELIAFLQTQDPTLDVVIDERAQHFWLRSKPYVFPDALEAAGLLVDGGGVLPSRLVLSHDDEEYDKVR